MPKTPKSLPARYTPAITAGAYSDGDQVGELLVFSDAGLGTHNAGVSLSLAIIDAIGQNAAFDLFIFKAVVTVEADNAAFAISAADMQAHCLGVISVAASNYKSAGTATIVQATNEGLVVGPSLTGDLYGALKLNGSTPTYSGVGNLTAVLGVLQD